MELYYSNKIEGNQIYLDEEESHHAIKVLRHKSGDELSVTDGKGKLYSCKLINDNRKECILSIEKILKEEEQKNWNLHIAIAPTKSTDRFEWFLEKATEIGVDEITPMICHRSERTKIKHERLNRILISSMKQSLRLCLPNMNPEKKFNDFISPFLSANTIYSIPNTQFIAHCQSHNLQALKSLYRKGENVLILIGPEGDFTSDEINLAEQSGFTSVSLSESRLRTETAGIVAAHTIQLLNN